VDAGRSAGATLEADDALDGLEVAEPPQLEALLDIDELLAHLVGVPVLVRCGVDAPQQLSHARMGGVRLRDVAPEHVGRHVVAAAREEAQEGVVEARRLEIGAQGVVQHRVVREHREHLGVHVAQQELDGAVLQRLEARRLAQHVAELHVLDGRQRLEHRPLLEHLALDRLDPGEALERVRDRRA
jgi:hypothetical protein